MLLTYQIFGSANETNPKREVDIPLEVPLYDFPYNQSSGYTFPSMAQSLYITKSFYQFSHNLIERNISSRFWRRTSIVLFDVFSLYFPPGDAWLHEEAHRAVMGQYGIDSYNEVYDIPLFSETIAVSDVTDEELIGLKRDHPADMVRLHSAGIESQYELVLKLEKDQFFSHSPTWDQPLIWLNYLNNFAYLATCASNESNSITNDILNAEDQDVSNRDFTGLDCNAWVYDLFRPNEAYTDRGVHPSGVGVDRYIRYSDLTSEEQDYLKTQVKLSLLNFIDPFLFGVKSLDDYFGTPNNDWRWNATIRHHITPFGNNIGVNVFMKKETTNLFWTLNYYSNKNNRFMGLDASALRYPFQIKNLSLQSSLRASVWLQPKDQSFYANEKSLGYLISVKSYYSITKNFELFLELMNKQSGWVPSEVSLDSETAGRLGFAYHIRSGLN